MVKKPYTSDYYIKKSKKIHGNKFNYSLVDFIHNKQKVKIICPIHGIFEQRFHDHFASKTGCLKCGYESTLKNHPNIMTVKRFIKQSQKIHNNKYDYSKINYIDMSTHVIIACPIHGDFSQRPDKHLTAKQNCPKCANITIGENQPSRITQDIFIEKAYIIHNGKYDYSIVKYHNLQQKVTIICPIHGKFRQKPFNHIYGKSGCTKCSNNNSKKETEWLDSLNIPNTPEYRHVIISTSNKKYFVDGYDPKTKTIYEFNGDYWHGNPDTYNKFDIHKQTKKTFGELYKQTIKKENDLREHGYNVISIWENDWIKSNEV